MASEYKYKDERLTSVGVVATELTKKMTSDTTFTLADYGFNDTDTSSYCTAATYNSGTWGVLKDTFYRSNGIPLPLIDAISIPHLYVDTSTSTYYVKFPNQDITNNGTSIKYIPQSSISSTMTISYDSSTSMLSATCGSTSLLNVKASPYTLIAIQAAGGNGGSGRAGAYGQSLVTVTVPTGGGGGGGSGGFALLSANTTYTDVTITPYSGTYYVTASDTSSQKTLRVHKGDDGKNSSYSVATDADGWATIFDHEAGSGGAGGTVAIYNARGAQVDSSPADSTLCDDVYVVDCINGGTGGDGVKNKDYWSAASKTSGTRGNGPGTYNVYLSSNHNILSCHKWGTSSTSVGGLGEQSSATSAHSFSGGGGGAASLMADGASHGNTGGLGSGGHGGSGWCNDRLGLSNGDGDGVGSYGGPGAVWLYYVPI